MNNELLEKLRIPKHLIMRCQVIPIEVEQDCLYVGMTEPYDIEAIDELSVITGLRIEPVAFKQEKILKMLQNYGINSKIDNSDSEAIFTEQQNTINIAIPKPDVLSDLKNPSAVEILEYIIYQAISCSASDIHIEPQEDCVRVRQRVDGILKEVISLPLKIKLSLTARVKILAELDIAEKRLPQDGRIKLRVNGRNIDLRVSTSPTILGEKCVIRLLYKDSGAVNINQLGFSDYNLDRFNNIIKKSHGMVLLTGPTGSGKTTTLYAVLRELGSPEKNVITIEDPVEYTLPGINQIQVNPRAGLTFAAGLRSILRQDPDIIMVGEIRDRETAEIAVQAATTGHLVLSTLHTGDAAGALIRLMDMGIEPYLVASSILGVVSQRLVRVLCPVCRTKHELTQQEKIFWGINKEEVNLYRESGCEHCDYTGFKGRICISEVLPMSKNVKQIINNKASRDDINELAIKEGFSTLIKDGLGKALQGITSLEEIMRVSFMED